MSCHTALSSDRQEAFTESILDSFNIPLVNGALMMFAPETKKPTLFGLTRFTAVFCGIFMPPFFLLLAFDLRPRDK